MAKSSYLCFHKGPHYCAIESSETLRILPVQSLCPLPLPLPAVNGLMILDDILVAVVDLVSVIFHEDQTESSYYIFVKSDQEMIGICADSIDGVKTIDDKTWEPYHKMHLPFIHQEEEEILYLIHLK